MRCDYKNCFCSDSDELIMVGNGFYHTDCNKTRKDINDIVALYREKIDEKAVISQLYSIVNNIIFNKNVQCGFLKYALQFYIKNNIPINHPLGLHYIIKNKKVINEWEIIQKKKFNEEIKNDFNDLENKVHNFNYKKQKKKSITDLLGD